MTTNPDHRQADNDVTPIANHHVLAGTNRRMREAICRLDAFARQNLGGISGAELYMEAYPAGPLPGWMQPRELWRLSRRLDLPRPWRQEATMALLRELESFELLQLVRLVSSRMQQQAWLLAAAVTPQCRPARGTAAEASGVRAGHLRR